MRLSEFVPGLPFSGRDTSIAGLSRDSRTVQAGFLFAAITGEGADGTAYIPQAIAQGAHAVLAKTGTAVPAGVTALLVDEPRRVLSQLASRFYNMQPATIVAVTGTSGKTSTVQFTRQIWQHLGHKSASIGTLGIIGDGIERYGSLTTPDAISLHHDLAMLAREKAITHVAMEASSHGLEQFRMDGVCLKAAAFTNLSRDHLDYHKTMQAYLAAKLRLFAEILPQGATAVLNRDCTEYDAVAAAAQKHGLHVMTFGNARADITLVNRTPHTQGQDVVLSVHGKTTSFSLPLVGAFQVANIMGALGLAIASGEDAECIMQNISALQGVPGRMQFVGSHKGGAVYVDYAHKPDALENVLSALRPHTQGKLRVVLGCGGNRDVGKRPLMGAIAARQADDVIVTDDNPRFEEPALIRHAVLEGCPGATEIGDRGQAIAEALARMGPGDVVVIAGKGHEHGQIIGDKTLPFDDADVARSCMRGAAA